MKPKIHPEYKKATVRCICGNTWETRSTVGDFSVEICSACHPFYTGKQKLIDTAGRVERFRRRYAKSGAGKGESKDAEKPVKTESDTGSEASAS